MFTPLDPISPDDAWVAPDGRLSRVAHLWLNVLRLNVRSIANYTPSIDPASVAANTTSEQTFTVAGVQAGDVVLACNKPTHTAGLIVGHARVSADNEVALTFANVTAGAIDAPAETYALVTLRP